MHCSSHCIATFGCSAFHFQDWTAICELGSNLRLLNGGPENLTVQIHTFASGLIKTYIDGSRGVHS